MSSPLLMSLGGEWGEVYKDRSQNCLTSAISVIFLHSRKNLDQLLDEETNYNEDTEDSEEEQIGYLAAQVSIIIILKNSRY